MHVIYIISVTFKVLLTGDIPGDIISESDLVSSALTWTTMLAPSTHNDSVSYSTFGEAFADVAQCVLVPSLAVDNIRYLCSKTLMVCFCCAVFKLQF